VIFQPKPQAALSEVERAAAETRAYSCLDCGMCSGVCPTARANRHFSPRLVVQRALLAADDLLREPELWSCLACGACSVVCPSNVDFPGFVRRLRARAWQIGERGVAAHGGVFAAVARLSESLGERGADRRLNWAEGLNLPAKGDTLFFAGCAPYFDTVFAGIGARPTSALRDAARLMLAAGTRPALLGNEACCGHDALWTGNVEQFERLARRNLELINASGATRVVTNCPECARTLKLDYPAVGKVGFEVLHFSQLLDELMVEGKLSGKFSGKLSGKLSGRSEGRVAYHDPCRLARHLKAVEEPRRVLSSIEGVSLAEPEDSGERTLCCGTSAWQGCDYFSEAIRVRRLKEAQAAGASILVTACPKCQIHFRCTLSCRPDERGLDAGLEIVDLATFVARAAGLSGDKP